jgi:hypothetical protein
MLKKIVSALLLCLFTAVASAAPTCWAERFGGTGKGYASTSIDGVGSWAAWWCEANYGWTLVYVTQASGFVFKHPPADAGQTLLQTLDAYYTLNAIDGCTLPDETCKTIGPAALATLPPPIVWTVAPGTAADRSRPTSLIVDGVLKTTAVRAAAGEACECKRLSFVNGSSTYCGVRSLPNVALCKKV